MNKLICLIQELCPNGVEYLPLEKCCTILDNKRKPVTKAAREAGEYPYYGANGIQDYVSDYIFNGTFVLVGEDGSVITSNGTPVVTWATGKIWVNNHAHIISEIDGVLLRYLFHYLQTVNVTPLIHGNIPKLTGGDFRALRIPLPPLAVQQEIVRILDSFTELTTELNKKLTAELTARRKQYEHYRDELLSVGGDFKTYPLGEVTEFIRNGYNYKADGDRSKTYKISRIETISTGVINMERVGSSEQINGRYLLQDGDILFSHINSLPYLGNVAYYTENLGKLYHGMNLLCFRAKKELVIPKYLYYVLKSNNIRKLVNRYAKQSCNQYSLTTSDIKSWTIPLPSLEQQEDIVSVLDRFDVICNDLTSGLPAEITARQKQYEYYRDKLLTFKELES